MPMYLFEASYSEAGLNGLVEKGGSSRQDALRAMIEGAGGRLESLYFAQGEADVFVTAELPDATTAAAISLTVGASGAIRDIRTISLFTPEEIDEAAEKTVDYRPPGS